MMPSNGDLEGRLRHLAFTLFMVAIAIYVSVHLILAVAPVLLIIGVLAAIGLIVRTVISNRRW